MNRDVLTRFFDFDKDELEYEYVVENFSKIDVEYGVDVIFRHYRKHGFPYYIVTEHERHKIMRKLIQFNHRSIMDGDKIIQTMNGLRLAWSYFPHWVNIKCGNMVTPMENFNDDKRLKSVLKKVWIHRLKFEPDKKSFSENRFRQWTKLHEGSQAVSNFRPTAAKVIYEEYGGNGVTWDMSAGWGGRLLGALSSSTIKKYIGTEPSTKTYDGLIKMKSDFEYLGRDIEIHKLGSEEFIPEKESLDLCFTSPPYFDTEKYSEEDTQSYIKFPTKDKWLNEFLRSTFENCWNGLKTGGYMLINIAIKGDTAGNDIITLAEKIGFVHSRTLQLSLSTLGDDFKYEPVFVFKKGEKK